MQKAACDLLLDLTDNDAVIVPKLVARDLGVTIDSYLQMIPTELLLIPIYK